VYLQISIPCPFHTLPLGTEDLIATWLRCERAEHRALPVFEYPHRHPARALEIIVRIAEEPGAEDHLAGLADPLLLLISRWGMDTIDSIEAAAATSARFRLCLGMVDPNPAQPIPQALWNRLTQAANLPLGPPDDSSVRLFSGIPGLAQAISAEIPGPSPTPPDTDLELGLVAKDWVTYQETRWASWEVDRIARHEPADQAIGLLCSLAEAGDSSARGTIGAGPLENLLVYRGHELIAQVEDVARRSSAFREALSGVWRRGMNDTLWRRICISRGTDAT